MATLSNTQLTLLDHAKRTDPSGKIGEIVNILAQRNRILDDMITREGSLPNGDQAIISTGLPDVYYKLANAGTPESKSETTQVTENAALLVGRSNLDLQVAKNGGNVNKLRMSESLQFMEAMSQKMAQTLFYGTNANPKEFVGFSPRYSDLSAANAENILDAGGTGSDNASVWLVGWGDRSIHGIFGKGSKAGLEHADLGITNDVRDADGNPYRAYQDEFTWSNGLMVRDWRYAARVANIDVSDLVGQTGTQALTAATSITKMMTRAIDRLPETDSVKASFYVNRTVASHLRIVAQEKSSSVLAIEPGTNQFGKTIHTLTFLGIPVRLVDQLVSTEARVV